MRIIGYFKQESTPINKVLCGIRLTFVVVNKSLLCLILLLMAVFLCTDLSACTQTSLTKKTGHNLIKTVTVSDNKTDASSWQNNKPVNITGKWKMGFRYQGKTGLSTLQIQQNNHSFSGLGKDEQNGATFKIDSGSIKGDEIIFLKRYDARSGPPVQYHGKFSYLSTENGETPYMGGDFSLETNGALTVGEWEAAIDELIAPAANPVNEKSTVAIEPPSHTDIGERCPDLSGKWNLAYEYNFKIAHATLFLEQDGNKLSGHGYDLNNKQKFVIKKGWYSYPHITIIRQNIGGVESGRTITFKADVTYVSDKDYTGPYLSGKTQGGGEWEAERVN